MPGFSIQTHADSSLRDDWPDSDVINVLSRDFNALQEPFFKEVGMEKDWLLTHILKEDMRIGEFIHQNLQATKKS